MRAYRTRKSLLHQLVTRPEAWRDLAQLAQLWVGPQGLSEAVMRAAVSKARHTHVLGMAGSVNPCTLLLEAITHRLDPPRPPGGYARIGVDVEAYRAAGNNTGEISRLSEAVLALAEAWQYATSEPKR